MSTKPDCFPHHSDFKKCKRPDGRGWNLTRGRAVEVKHDLCPECKRCYDCTNGCTSDPKPVLYCKSRIRLVRKRGKAAGQWPETSEGPVSDLPEAVCHGEIEVEVLAVDEPHFGGSAAALTLRTKCSRCDAPYFPGLVTFQQEVWSGSFDFVKWLLMLRDLVPR